jgi:hypothetical protein
VLIRCSAVLGRLLGVCRDEGLAVRRRPGLLLPALRWHMRFGDASVFTPETRSNAAATITAFARDRAGCLEWACRFSRCLSKFVELSFNGSRSGSCSSSTLVSSAVADCVATVPPEFSFCEPFVSRLPACEIAPTMRLRLRASSSAGGGSWQVMVTSAGDSS